MLHIPASEDGKHFSGLSSRTVLSALKEKNFDENIFVNESTWSKEQHVRHSQTTPPHQKMYRHLFHNMVLQALEPNTVLEKLNIRHPVI